MLTIYLRLLGFYDGCRLSFNVIHSNVVVLSNQMFIFLLIISQTR